MLLMLRKLRIDSSKWPRKLLDDCNKKCVNSQRNNSRIRLCRGYITVSQISNYFRIVNNGVNRNSLSFKNVLYYSDIRTSNTSNQEFDLVEFEKISNETLESLMEYFDELIENAAHLDEADVSYGDGVLTIKFGDKYGTYVINRQTPNRQIWLSSPTSGPKRYDFIDHTWLYKHDGKSMHDLLDEEISKIVEDETSFNKCIYGNRNK